MTTLTPFASLPTRPTDYIGWTPANDPDITNHESWRYAGPIETRDSDALECSNAAYITSAFEAADPDGEHHVITNSNHWAVGWVRNLWIDTSHPATTDVYTDIATQLEDHPILDEDDYSQREGDELYETLTGCYGLTDDEAGAVMEWSPCPFDILYISYANAERIIAEALEVAGITRAMDAE